MPAIHSSHRLTDFILGRPGNDFDMAATVLFLAGPGGVFYNEQVLFPDGGRSISPLSIFARTHNFQETHLLIPP